MGAAGVVSEVAAGYLPVIGEKLAFVQAGFELGAILELKSQHWPTWLNASTRLDWEKKKNAHHH